MFEADLTSDVNEDEYLYPGPSESNDYLIVCPKRKEKPTQEVAENDQKT
jgi:hypothetical protein